MKIKCLFLTALLLTVTSIGSAQSKSGATPVKGITKRVALSITKPCVVLEGSVQPKNFDTYILKVRKGQTVIASPYYYGEETDRPADDEQGLSGFVIVMPNGEKSEDPQDDQFQAEKSGEYKILVRPAYTRTNAKYRLKISVTDKAPETFDDLNAPPKCQ